MPGPIDHQECGTMCPPRSQPNPKTLNIDKWLPASWSKERRRRAEVPLAFHPTHGLAATPHKICLPSLSTICCPLTPEYPTMVSLRRPVAQLVSWSYSRMARTHPSGWHLRSQEKARSFTLARWLKVPGQRPSPSAQAPSLSQI